MVRFGTPIRWLWVGLRIVTDIGTGSVPGVGLGWTIHRGALLRFTMGDGRLLAAGGVGARGPFMRVHSMARHLWALLVEDISDLGSDSAVALAAESGGSRWASGNRTILGTTRVTAISAT